MKKEKKEMSEAWYSEAWHQKQIFRWARANQIRHPELQLLNSSLNGVRLPISLAKKMKAQGMKKGYPDIFLPVPKNNYHGLFIELKKETGGKVSVDQIRWLEKLSELGYYTTVQYGYKQTIEKIKQYLEI